MAKTGQSTFPALPSNHEDQYSDSDFVMLEPELSKNDPAPGRAYCPAQPVGFHNPNTTGPILTISQLHSLDHQHVQLSINDLLHPQYHPVSFHLGISAPSPFQHITNAHPDLGHPIASNTYGNPNLLGPAHQPDMLGPSHQLNRPAQAQAHTQLHGNPPSLAFGSSASGSRPVTLPRFDLNVMWGLSKYSFYPGSLTLTFLSGTNIDLPKGYRAL